MKYIDKSPIVEIRCLAALQDLYVGYGFVGAALLWLPDIESNQKQ